jgi:hypothetical protein
MRNWTARQWIALLALGACLAWAPAHAATDKEPAKKEPTKQQQKMKTCNADAKAKSLSGDPRKQFMKECLSAK